MSHKILTFRVESGGGGGSPYSPALEQQQQQQPDEGDGEVRRIRLEQARLQQRRSSQLTALALLDDEEARLQARLGAIGRARMSGGGIGREGVAF